MNGPFWDWLLFPAIGLAPDDRLGETIRFFVFDTTKILLLLSGIIFIVTILRSFISLERTRALLGGKREGLANVAAAALGVATPFCSCSAVPAFIGFVSAGVPIGVTLSFLIASPLVNEIAVVMLFTLFGWRIALLYVIAGLTIAVVAGYVLGRVHVERWVEPFVFETKVRAAMASGVKLSWRDRVADRSRGGRLDRAQGLPVPARRDRDRRHHPRLGADELLPPLRGLGQPARRAGRRTDRRAPVLERRRRHAARRRAPPEGPRDGHAARLHDVGGRAVAARDDPAAADPQAAADRRRSSASSPSASCVVGYLFNAVLG